MKGWHLLALAATCFSGTTVSAQVVEDPSLAVADLVVAAQPSDPTEASTRLARSTYFNDPAGLALGPDSQEQIWFSCTGRVQSVDEMVKQTPVIFAGTATSASAFVTQDRHWVYSEFNVTPDTVLKDSTRTLSAGGSATILRPGGGLRRPDGQVVRLKFGYHGYPQIGQRYLFFGRSEPLLNGLPLVAAYSLGSVTEEGVRDLDTDRRLPSFAGMQPAGLLDMIRGLVGQRQ